MSSRGVNRSQREELSNLPSRWASKRFKFYCAKYSDYGLNESAESYTDEGVRFIRTSDLDDHGRLRPEGVYLDPDIVGNKLLESGDLLISRSGTIGRTFLFEPNGEEQFSYAGYLVRYRPDNSLSSKFAAYYTHSRAYKSLVSKQIVSATIGNVNGQKFANIPVPAPDIEEQQTIARFLDYRTAQLDGLIKKKRQLLDRLAEKRSALITRAVTNGLDPDAPMKDSGVPWLGEIPAHWQTLNLARISESRTDGPFGSGIKSEHYADQGVRVIRLQNIRSAQFDDSDKAFLDENYVAERLGERYQVLSGDLLIAGLGDERMPVGRACVAPALASDAIVKADCFRFRIIEEKAIPEFVALQLCSTAHADSAALATGVTRQRINLSRMSARQLFLPPVSEQADIVGQLAERLAAVERPTFRIDKAISGLMEYRSALITAAVTGQIDVRGWRPPA